MGNLYDLRDRETRNTSHPLADSNVVVIDPDTGDVFDPRDGYTAPLPPTNLLAVPRTTWYAPPEERRIVGYLWGAHGCVALYDQIPDPPASLPPIIVIDRDGTTSEPRQDAGQPAPSDGVFELPRSGWW